METQKDSLANSPTELTLSETLQLLVKELTQCAETLRKTHELVAPQLAELEKRYPNALAGDNDKRSMGSPTSSNPA